ncbi:tail assembly chaperone [Halorubrum sodomense tailed virus 2]|uniref:Tail assembly chaperone n=1 Tax=Halorubrum sodomense tailed virus 2 TaxID=1262527 RepID=L7TN56_9CAUD|nr:tail assembly chaperone [Halorubrum sodomense tailed virus 2]AGC34292.1 tail assembly chaperone [Halorubrum sodomense tailed virus 2]
MTESETELTETAEDTENDSEKDVNISKLREMALRGDSYREPMDFTYYGLEGELVLRPLADPQFLPIAAMLEARLDIDAEEAQEMLEDGKDPEDGSIDPSQFDEEFVQIMSEAAVMGIDRTQGIAEGETEEGIREILGVGGEGIGLQGGKTLKIAERVLNMSSDAESAKSFRRDGAASSFVTLFKDYNMGFHGSDDQLSLTPLQRQIIEAEEARRARAQEEKMEEMRNPSGSSPGAQAGAGRPRNSRAGGAGNSTDQKETVRYINKSENPDFQFPNE